MKYATSFMTQCQTRQNGVTVGNAYKHKSYLCVRFFCGFFGI